MITGHSVMIRSRENGSADKRECSSRECKPRLRCFEEGIVSSVATTVICQSSLDTGSIISTRPLLPLPPPHSLIIILHQLRRALEILFWQPIITILVAFPFHEIVNPPFVMVVLDD